MEHLCEYCDDAAKHRVEDEESGALYFCEQCYLKQLEYDKKFSGTNSN